MAVVLAVALATWIAGQPRTSGQTPASATPTGNVPWENHGTTLRVVEPAPAAPAADPKPDVTISVHADNSQANEVREAEQAVPELATRVRVLPPGEKSVNESPSGTPAIIGNPETASQDVRIVLRGAGAPGTVSEEPSEEQPPPAAIPQAAPLRMAPTASGVELLARLNLPQRTDRLELEKAVSRDLLADLARHAAGNASELPSPTTENRPGTVQVTEPTTSMRVVGEIGKKPSTPAKEEVAATDRKQPDGQGETIRPGSLADLKWPSNPAKAEQGLAQPAAPVAMPQIIKPAPTTAKVAEPAEMPLVATQEQITRAIRRWSDRLGTDKTTSPSLVADLTRQSVPPASVPQSTLPKPQVIRPAIQSATEPAEKSAGEPNEQFAKTVRQWSDRLGSGQTTSPSLAADLARHANSTGTEQPSMPQQALSRPLRVAKPSPTTQAATAPAETSAPEVNEHAAQAVRRWSNWLEAEKTINPDPVAELAREAKPPMANPAMPSHQAWQMRAK